MLFSLLSIAFAGIPQGSVGLAFDSGTQEVAGALVLDTSTLEASGARLMRGKEVVAGQIELRVGMRVAREGSIEKLAGGPGSLVAFDTNGDGYLDAADPAFKGLSLFVDFNEDGQRAPTELVPLHELGVQWISQYGDVAFDAP